MRRYRREQVLRARRLDGINHIHLISPALRLAAPDADLRGQVRRFEGRVQDLDEVGGLRPVGVHRRVARRELGLVEEADPTSGGFGLFSHYCELL